MRRLDVAGERGRPISEFGSVDAFVRGITRNGQAVFIRLAPGGRLGRHPAGVSQLFLVVSGSGWVSGGDSERLSVAAGEAVVWEQGEEHESGSDEGMLALVVEAERLDL